MKKKWPLEIKTLQCFLAGNNLFQHNYRVFHRAFHGAAEQNPRSIAYLWNSHPPVQKILINSTLQYRYSSLIPTYKSIYCNNRIRFCLSLTSFVPMFFQTIWKTDLIADWLDDTNMLLGHKTVHQKKLLWFVDSWLWIHCTLVSVANASSDCSYKGWSFIPSCKWRGAIVHTSPRLWRKEIHV